MTLVLEDMEIDAFFTVKTADDLQIKVVSTGGAATIDLTGPGNGAYYSGIQLGDDVFPFDAAGHYWGIIHDSPSHNFSIFNYNGTTYTNALTALENGAIGTDRNTFDDGSGNSFTVGYVLSSSDSTKTSNKATWLDNTADGGGLLMYNAGDDMVYQIAADIYSVGSDLPWIAGLTGGWIVTSAFDHTGTFSFAVGNSTTAAPGLGNAPFTVFDDLFVTTFNNTLDDGFGNMTVAGTFAVQADAYTVQNTLDDGSGNMFINGVFTATNAIVLNHAGSSAFIVAVGASDGNSYSNLELADNVYPLDAAGHYWSFSHRVTTHELLIYNYNGSSYENRLIITEGGAVETAINTLDDGAGAMSVVSLTTTGVDGLTVVQGGIGITAGGMLISADGMTVHGASTFANALTISTGGLTITAGGLTVTAGLSSFAGGTDTSGTAAFSSPTFVSGTAKQLSTVQDVMLYIYCKTAASQTVALAIGPTSTPANTMISSATVTPATGSMWCIRVPKGWWVKLTGTVADYTFSQITC